MAARKRWTVAVIWPKVPLIHLTGEVWATAEGQGGAACCGVVIGRVWNMPTSTYRQLDRHGKVCSRCKGLKHKRPQSQKTGTVKDTQG